MTTWFHHNSRIETMVNGSIGKDTGNPCSQNDVFQWLDGLKAGYMKVSNSGMTRGRHIQQAHYARRHFRLLRV